MTDKVRLTAEDWINAAMARLVAHGAQGVRLDAIAGDLGVTKGSFYWHFKGMPALLEELCARIERDVEEQLLDALTQEAAPDDLMSNIPGWDPLLDEALREWARHDDTIKALVARLDRRRLGTLGEILAGQGMDATRLPLLMYAVQLGLDRLDTSIGPLPRVTRRALVSMQQRGRASFPRAS